ncbi:MAG: hypothetical protein U9N44_00700, partial [Chloroflexota bacterium]|nr:hypothetical protein [Chloroflexota bacterium]
MRLTHLWTALLLGIALTLTACGNEAEVDQWSNSPLAVICADEDDSGSEVSLNEDYYLVIILERHPRLGYYWSLSDSYSESILH